jgi:hypothetical protein
MKDVQMPSGGSGQRIPVLSALSHCCGMTVVVFLRSSFGYNYFRPRSVFFALSWAFTLFCVYAWNEPEVWIVYHRVCIFGIAAMVLYWTHFGLAFANEWTKNWRHDRYTGKSHIVRLLSLAGVQRTPQLEEALQIWAEPWLVYAACFLWCKEAINAWFGMRHDKKQKDIFDDAAHTVEPMAEVAKQTPVIATRKERVKRQRNTAGIDETAQEQRYAGILRLRTPYSIETAEENYRALIRLEHPDATGKQSPEDNARAAELNDAIAFFRENLEA